MKILAIDDDEDVRDVIQLRLEMKGFEMVLKNNGPEALSYLADSAQSPPDLILCDVLMPGMNGYEVCRAVREKGIKTPFLFLTGKGYTDDKVRGLESGADDYIVKPFDLHELEAKVNALLRHR